ICGGGGGAGPRSDGDRATAGSCRAGARERGIDPQGCTANARPELGNGPPRARARQATPQVGRVLIRKIRIAELADCRTYRLQAHGLTDPITGDNPYENPLIASLFTSCA